MIKHFPTRLGAHRFVSGRPSVQIARTLGVNRSTYATWEYGYSKPRSMEDIMRLEKYYLEPVDLLFTPAAVLNGAVVAFDTLPPKREEQSLDQSKNPHG